MKLSNEAINDSIRFQETKKPIVYCISSKNKFYYLKKAIISYKGEAEFVDEVNNYGRNLNSDVILLRLDTIYDEIFGVERFLIKSAGKKKSIILDISGVNLSIDKRDMALSFLNRYNIDLIIGTNDEILYLINGQKKDKKNLYENYRDFSKRNKTVLLVYGEEYFITDGYSEFIIGSKNNEIGEIVDFNCILSGIIAVATASCRSREEKVKSILIAVNAFEICKDLAVDKIRSLGEVSSFLSSLFNEILNISSEIIYENSKILYIFKR